MTWVLILYLSTFATASGMAVTSAPGFVSAEKCEAAGAEAKKRLTGAATQVRWACVEQ